MADTPVTESQNKLNAALRYAGASASTLFTVFGVLQFVTPDQVAQLTQAVHDFNQSVLSAYGALTKMWIILGPVALFWLGKVGFQSSSVQAMAGKLLKIATSAPSPEADEAKNKLIAATIALPEVQTIVTDAKTAAASESPSVVSKAE